MPEQEEVLGKKGGWENAPGAGPGRTNFSSAKSPQEHVKYFKNIFQRRYEWEIST